MGLFKSREASLDNIYTLDGPVPLAKSVPFGLHTFWPCSWPTSPPS